MLGFILSLADTLATCFNDQVLGKWEFYLSAPEQKPENGVQTCSKTFEVNETKTITLIAPNVAIDEDGYEGTWTISWTQSITVRIGLRKYIFYFDFWRDPLNESFVYTNCSCSLPTQAWFVEQSRVGCVSAKNVKPVLNSTVNHIVTPDSPYNFTINKKVFEQTYKQQSKKQKFFSNVFESANYSGDKLPASFDWRNVNGKSYVNAPGDQDENACGSCYIWATTYMMASRMAIAKQDPSKLKKLSIQQMLDCNYYSQGCLGGFAEHVGQYIDQYGIVEEKDYAKYSKQQKKCMKSAKHKYYTTATEPFGGYVGAVTTAQEIQWELYRNGPMVVSVLVDDKFYENDPYGVERKIELNQTESPERHYFYSEINHAVLLIGWVTELVNGKNETFWIILNSFGSTWGKNKDGTMKIVMGRNAYGIESQPVVTTYREDFQQQHARPGIVAICVIVVIIIALAVSIFPPLLGWIQLRKAARPEEQGLLNENEVTNDKQEVKEEQK